MLKFVFILCSVFSVNFLVSYNASVASSQPGDVVIQFSETAIAIESGQPVYAKGTKIWLSNPAKEEMKIYLNEQEKEMNAGKIELSEITNLNEGTYTLVVNTNSDERIFGFTIQ